MPYCLIGLGSNLGDRKQLLSAALARLARHPQIAVVACSRLEETPAVGGPANQSPFLNAAAVVETSLLPTELLAELQEAETELGRRREIRWGPRTIDLDLLLYDRLTLDTPTLVLPHPRMAWRRFVLEPAAEIASEMVHPATGWTIGHLLAHLNTTPWYVAITGPIGAGKSALATQLLDSRVRENADSTRHFRLLAEEFDISELAAFYYNPSGLAEQIELEFLQQRARALDAKKPEWADCNRFVVSDFWFEQSPAFARVWLDAAAWPAYQSEYDRLRTAVVRPRLIVRLRPPVETLLARIETRGRRGEETLTAERLQKINEAISEQLSLPDCGPVLRLDALDEATAMIELVAAVDAMH